MITSLCDFSKALGILLLKTFETARCNFLGLVCVKTCPITLISVSCLELCLFLEMVACGLSFATFWNAILL